MPFRLQTPERTPAQAGVRFLFKAETMRHAVIVLALLAGQFLASPATAQPPGASEQQRLDWVLERGRLLFALDRAAWVATDDMLARIPDAANAGMLGYIVDRDSDGRLTTIFFGRENGGLVAAYRAAVGASGVENPEVYAAGARPPLTALQRRLAEAVLWARDNAAGLQRCNDRPFNIAAVPPSTSDGPIDIYLMTPQVDDSLPMGGHHRITIGPDRRELSRRAFARSCLTIPPPPQSGNAVGMVVSHLLDPHPTEIHVFTALAARTSVYIAVQSPERLFATDGRSIRRVALPQRR